MEMTMAKGKSIVSSTKKAQFCEGVVCRMAKSVFERRKDLAGVELSRIFRRAGAKFTHILK